MTTARIIDGASVCFETGLRFQPRLDTGELLWEVTYRESYGFSDGWSNEECWAVDKESAFFMAPNRGHRFKESHVVPVFKSEPIGWSTGQILAATVWLGDVIATRRIAEQFRPVMEIA